MSSPSISFSSSLFNDLFGFFSLLKLEKTQHSGKIILFPSILLCFFFHFFNFFNIFYTNNCINVNGSFLFFML
jgi:hypothetical protein